MCGQPCERAGAAAVADDVVDLRRGVAEPGQGGRDRGVDDLEVAAAGELLELDQGEVGLDAGGVAIHDQADRAGRGDDRDLGVAVAVLLAEFEHAVAIRAGGRQQVGGAVLSDRCRRAVMVSPSYSCRPARCRRRGDGCGSTRSMASRLAA